MKTTFLIKTCLLLLIISTMTQMGCSKEQSEDSQKEGPISIGLSESKLTFSNDNNSKVVNTKNALWEISRINAYVSPTDSSVYTNTSKEPVVKGDWFCVSKIGINELEVQLEKNSSEYNRKLQIILFSGSSYEELLVDQEY